jgi:hypothetical protein
MELPEIKRSLFDFSTLDDRAYLYGIERKEKETDKQLKKRLDDHQKAVFSPAKGKHLKCLGQAAGVKKGFFESEKKYRNRILKAILGR